jgi:predicted AAA+ superfamily ATPase
MVNLKRYQMYIPRKIEASVLSALENNPVVTLIGPRQCGKSTLAKHLLASYQDSIYLDLERPSDLKKLDDAEWFLSTQKGKLICIDEVQRKPELFSLIRSLVDDWNNNGSFLILGSASRDLLKQSSESLAGRISYKRLTPFLWKELDENYSIEKYYVQGGFPRSLLTNDSDVSYEWRENFISTFLERDLLQWRGFTPSTMRRLWQMIAHVNGQTVDYSTFAKSLDISAVTVRNYIDLLESTFMVEVVSSFVSNLGKRLVKAPKIYISDAGITAALLGLRNFEQLSGHPSFGAIWEQIVLSNLKGLFPEATFYFYRTSNGAEIDFVMKIRNTVFAIECKSSFSPTLSKGNYNAIEDITPKHVFVVSPIVKGWQMKQGIDLVSLDELEMKIEEMI